ncbi:MAG: NDP-sugar synthase [Candidatus Brockarchaeota archaeon]|nr:NDP-sugar synthase [Candidatus Brockarchaeota archaeon]
MRVQDLMCFIPVGGQAKRLRPLSHDVSKPCVRFLNRPLIEFSMITLAEQGVRNFIFGEMGYTNYANLFDQYGEGIGFSAKYRIEPRVHIKHQPNLDDLGSADSYRINMDYYDIRKPVIVVQGDNLFNMDLNDFVRRHEERNAVMSIALTRVKEVGEYGIAELGEDFRIKRFVEKPRPEQAPSSLANAGIYLLSPELRNIVNSEEVLRIRNERRRLDFGYDLIPYLVDNDFPVYGYEIPVWFDVGSPEKYLEAMVNVLRGALDIRVTEERIVPGRNIWVQGYSEESVKRREEIVRKHRENKLGLEGAVLIGRHTRIGDYSSITDSSIDNFCIIGENVNIERSAIMDAAKIGDYTRISDSIIGRKAIVESSQENPTSIESFSTIGNSVRIREGCRLINTRVNPGLILPPGMIYINKFLQSYEDVVKMAE